MPLVIALVFFALLFAGEGLWFDSCRVLEQAQLRRYQQVEHPRFSRRDSYIDALT